MRLAPGEDIGREVHHDRDQFLRIERDGHASSSGGTRARSTGRTRWDDWAIIVPAGIWHNVVNTGPDDLKLYSLYSPPEHPDGTVHETKADAEEAERAHHG